MSADLGSEEVARQAAAPLALDTFVYVCDRCGHAMVKTSCKVLCVNCGNRFDCSDLNLYFD